MFNSVKLIALSFLTILAGCQTAGQIWNPSISKDQFTDKVTKMVTVGEGLSNQIIITQSLRYYPFVGLQDGDIYVGIRSGGRYRIPTGTVQIRIDENNSWTINPEETPIYLAPSMPAPPSVEAAGMLDIVEKTQAQAMGNVARIMSPYTATRGDKARAILKEMVNGKVVKYRTVGFNQAASTTGEVKIDESFLSSLRAIGITPENM